MDEFVIMNVEDYQDICDAMRQVTGSSDTFTIGKILDLVDGLTTGELEDVFITRTLTSYSDEEATLLRSYCFAGMSNLSEVYFPNLTSLGTYTFTEVGSVKANTETFPKVTSAGSNAFRSSGVTEADFPLVTGSTGSWYGCKKLIRANFPNAKTLGSFNLCSALTECNIPLVTALGTNTLRGCNALQKIDLHCCTSVGSYAFYGNKLFDTLILRSNTVATLAATNALGSTPIAKGTGYIYVPSALVVDYKVATNWSTYADQIRAIEDYPEICGE